MLFELLIAIAAVVIIVLIVGKKEATLHSNWNTLIDKFDYSSKEFYALLRKELESRGVENISYSSEAHWQGSLVSSRRLYLRVKWKGYYYDCCCAPYGNGTFFSWWLLIEETRAEKMIARIPFVGGRLKNILFPMTYYRADTISMFMTYAQNSVLKVIDDITKDSGVRSIPSDERKPIMRDVFKR